MRFGHVRVPGRFQESTARASSGLRVPGPPSRTSAVPQTHDPDRSEILSVPPSFLLPGPEEEEPGVGGGSEVSL